MTAQLDALRGGVTDGAQLSAPGPDAWAASVGASIVHDEVHVYLTRGRDAGWIISPDEDGEASYHGRWGRAGETHPLQRNAAMVRAAAARAAIGHDVRCLALLDGTKRDAPGRRATRGTEHTVGLARAAGLAVRVETWTGAVTPGGG